MLWGQFYKHRRSIEKHEYHRVVDTCIHRGDVTFDMLKPEENWNKRVVMIVPGVVGCSSDAYVQELVHKVTESNYAAVVLNHLAPKKETTADLRCLDFSQDETMRDAFDFVDAHFKGNEGIYGVGFSLGGNYIMRSAGMPNAC